MADDLFDRYGLKPSPALEQSSFKAPPGGAGLPSAPSPRQPNPPQPVGGFDLPSVPDITRQLNPPKAAPRDLFDAYNITPPPPAPVMEAPSTEPNVLTDVATLFKRGLHQTAGAVQYLTGDTEGAMASIGKSEALLPDLSPEQRAASQKEFITTKDPDAPWYDLSNHGLGEAWSDLRSYGGMIVESGPATLAGMGAGGLAVKGLQVAAKGAISRAAVKAAQQAAARGVGAQAAQKVGAETAKRLATRTNTIAGAIGFGTSEGAVSGGLAGAQAQKKIRALPEEAFAESPLYLSMRAEGKTHPEAANAIAEVSGDEQAWRSGVAVGLLGAPMGIVFGRMIGGEQLAKTRLRAAGMGALGEAAQETPQSAAEQVFQNLADKKYIDPDTPMGRNLFNAAVSGGIAGGVMGLGMGGALHPGAQPTPPPPPGPTPPPGPPPGPQPPPAPVGEPLGLPAPGQESRPDVIPLGGPGAGFGGPGLEQPAQRGRTPGYNPPLPIIEGEFTEIPPAALGQDARPGRGLPGPGAESRPGRGLLGLPAPGQESRPEARPPGRPGASFGGPGFEQQTPPPPVATPPTSAPSTPEVDPGTARQAKKDAEIKAFNEAYDWFTGEDQDKNGPSPPPEAPAPSTPPVEPAFQPSHVLSDGTEVVPNFDNGQAIPNEWVDAEGSIVEDNYATPLTEGEEPSTPEGPTETEGESALADAEGAALETQEIPLSALKISTDVRQFKGDANEQGVVQPLEGNYDRLGTGPILVWERLNGDREVISGRHRFDLAQRTGEKTIPAQVVREAEGFTLEDAKVADAELNIRDEQGEVKDYANYFKTRGIRQGEAEQKGLLARAKGRDGFAIASQGSQALFELHQGGQLTDQQAAEIARTAPGDERLQSLGADALNKGKSLALATGLMDAVKAMESQGVKTQSEQGDIFGFDDSALQQAEAMSRQAVAKKQSLRDQINAVRGAAKRPEQARKLGVDVKNPKAIQAKIKELEAEAARWDNWPTNPELRAELMADSPKAEGAAKAEEEAARAKAQADQEAADQAQADKAKAEEEAKAKVEAAKAKAEQEAADKKQADQEAADKKQAEEKAQAEAKAKAEQEAKTPEAKAEEATRLDEQAIKTREREFENARQFYSKQPDSETRKALVSQTARRLADAKTKAIKGPPTFPVIDGKIKTLMGQEIPAPPPIRSGKIKTGRDVKAVDAWLLEQAKQEADFRQDDFNATMFGGLNPKSLSPDDKNTLNFYLFGHEYPSFIKSSPAGTKPAPAESPPAPTPISSAMAESLLLEANPSDAQLDAVAQFLGVGTRTSGLADYQMVQVASLMAYKQKEKIVAQLAQARIPPRLENLVRFINAQKATQTLTNRERLAQFKTVKKAIALARRRQKDERADPTDTAILTAADRREALQAEAKALDAEAKQMDAQWAKDKAEGVAGGGSVEAASARGQGPVGKRQLAVARRQEAGKKIDEIARLALKQKPAEGLTQAEQDAIKPRLEPIAQRLENARQSFISSVTEQFGLSEAQARDALEHLLKLKLGKLDAAMGQFNLKDGRLWNKAAMEKAAATETADQKPAKAKAETPSQPTVKEKPDFHTMVKAAVGWKYLQMKVAETLTDKRAQLKHSKQTTKGDLDAWIQQRFGVDANEAREVSNEAGAQGGYSLSNGKAIWEGPGPEPSFSDYPDIAKPAPSPLLSSYTEEELAQRKEEADAKTKAEQEARQKAEDKATADAEVGAFDLTGSDRPADRFGDRQGDVLDEIKAGDAKKPASPPKAEAAQDAEPAPLTPAEAAKRLTYRNLGTEGGVQTVRAYFADEDGQAIGASSNDLERISGTWRVGGEIFDTLKAAKAYLWENEILPKFIEEGRVKKAGEPETPKAPPEKTAKYEELTEYGNRAVIEMAQGDDYSEQEARAVLEEEAEESARVFVNDKRFKVDREASYEKYADQQLGHPHLTKKAWLDLYDRMVAARDITQRQKPPEEPATPPAPPEGAETRWNGLDEAQRLETARLAGWETKKGTPGPVAKRLSRQDWAALPGAAQKVLAQHFEKSDTAPTADPESAPYTPQVHKTTLQRLYEGSLSAAEMKAAFERLIASEAALKEQLKGRTLKQLTGGSGRTGGLNKAQIIDGIYDQMLQRYVLSDSFMWSPFSEDLKTAVRRQVENTTDETIERYLEARQQARSERQKALENPETLREFNTLVAARGEGALTDAQRAEYERLQAQQQRDARQRVESAQTAETQRATGEGISSQLKHTQHTRDGYDLFVIALEGRVSPPVYRTLIAQAKRLGGWYSKYAQQGAIPGFQFKDRGAAEQFQALIAAPTPADAEVVDQAVIDTTSRLDEKQKAAAQRLRTQAENLARKANETLNAERQTNTVRRANIASGIEAGARTDLAMAHTLASLAEAIESGETEFLQNLATRKHVEQLDALARRAMREYQQAHAISYSQSEGRQPDVTHIRYAQMPNLHPLARETLSVALAQIPGGQRLAKQIAHQPRLALADAEKVLALLGKNATQYATQGDGWQVREYVDNTKRLNRMGLYTDAELRTALREYLQFRSARQTEDPIKKLERALVGTRPGIDFFPTPGALARRLVEAAGIEPGMDVLEPSAGKGDIADAIRDAVPEAHLETIELSETLRDLLKAKGHTLTSSDFLTHEGLYDRIVMNPPFSEGQDADHVRHAFDLLKPGGKLVAITGEGIHFRQDKKATAFREWMAENNGVTEKLPEGSFKSAFRPTGVATRLVVLEKPAETQSPSRYSRAQTRTPAFKRWFGDSKVVDENGEPLVVYHLGKTKAYGEAQTVFYPGGEKGAENFPLSGTIMEKRMGSPALESGPGIWFGPKEALSVGARDFNRPGGTWPDSPASSLAATYPVYLSLKSPLIIKSHEQRAELKKRIKPYPERKKGVEFVPDFPYRFDGKQRQQLIKEGYDGIILDTPGQDKEYVAFYSEQIKSALGNQGTFDPANPDIRYARLDAAPGGAMQRRGILPVSAPVSGGYPAAQSLQADLETAYGAGIIRRLIRSGRLTVTETVPAGHPSDAAGITLSGTMTLVGSNIAPGEAPNVLLHEAVHAGLRQALGDQAFQNLLLSVNAQALSGKNPAFARARARALRGFEGMAAPTPWAVAEETVSYLVEETGARWPVVRQILAKVRRFLRSLGLVKGYTPSDLVDMTRQALHRLARTDTPARLENRSPARYSLRSTGNPDLDGFYERAGLAGQPTLREKLAAVWNLSPAQRQTTAQGAGRKTVEGVFDRFNKVKQLLEDRGMNAADAIHSGYVKLRMSSNMGSIMHALLLKSSVAVNSEGLLTPRGSQGFMDVLKPVMTTPEQLREWLSYRAAKRARRLLGVNKERNFTPAQIKAVLDHVQSDPAKVALFDQTWREADAFMDSALTVAVKMGLLDEATKALWQKHGDHIPFFRALEDSFLGPSGGQGFSHQEASKRLLGGTSKTNDLLANMITSLSHLIEASLKNQAITQVKTNLPDLFVKLGPQFQRAHIPRSQIKTFLKEDPEFSQFFAQFDLDESAIDTLPSEVWDGIQKMWAMKPPAGEDVVRIMEAGKPVYYRVEDPDLVEVLKNINPAPLGSWIKPFQLAKRILTVGATAQPTFWVTNLIRDIVHAKMIYPDLTFREIFKGVKQSLLNQGKAVDMAMAGASFQGGYLNANDPGEMERTIRSALRQAGIHTARESKGVVFDWTGRAWEQYMQIGFRVENAVREAVYEHVLNRTGSTAQAAFEARDLMDYSLQGNAAAMQILTQSIPFLNARMQGLSKVTRAHRADRRVAVRGLMLALVSAALLALNHDDERYQALEEWERNLYWHIFFPDDIGLPLALTHIKIPKPFEFGAIYGTVLGERLPMAMIEAAGGQGDRPDQTKAALWSVLRDNLSIDWRPQLVRPLLEVQANQSSFFRRPIEGMADEGKLPQARYNAFTSPVMKGVGSVIADPTGLSPKQMEYLWRGYTGTLGMYALSVADWFTRIANNEPLPPASQIGDLPMMRAILQTSNKNTRYQSEFYELRSDIGKIYGTVRAYQREQNTAEAFKVWRENREKLQYKPLVEAASRQIRDIRKRMDAVYRSNRTRQEKREQIDAMQDLINGIAERVTRVAL